MVSLYKQASHPSGDLLILLGQIQSHRFLFYILKLKLWVYVVIPIYLISFYAVLKNMSLYLGRSTSIILIKVKGLPTQQ